MVLSLMCRILIVVYATNLKEWNILIIGWNGKEQNKESSVAAPAFRKNQILPNIIITMKKTLFWCLGLGAKSVKNISEKMYNRNIQDRFSQIINLSVMVAERVLRVSVTQDMCV